MPYFVSPFIAVFLSTLLLFKFALIYIELWDLNIELYDYYWDRTFCQSFFRKTYHTVPSSMFQVQSASFQVQSASISPSNAKAAGPVIYTWSSASLYSMWSVPPSITMLLWREARLVRAAATAVAQAPVPHAIVIPLPLSQTRVLIMSVSVTCANSMLQRWGKALSLSRILP